MRFLPVVGGIILIASLVAHADIIVLDDGTRLEGTARRVADQWIITTTKGAVLTVKADRVVSIEVGRSNPDDGSEAKSRLSSLRRVVDNMSDIPQIIDRYEKFIAANPDSPILDDANKDLATWHQRLDRGLVKIGSKWVTQQERDQLRDGAQAEALQARDLIKQNRLKEADPILQKALLDDPESATALYLRGVMLYSQDQVSQAKKAFETVNQLIPNYAPALNNLAVIAWRQKSFVGAMNYYDQAMAATPLAKQVLDNVAEAFHALPDENKQAPAVKRCAARFQEQDTEAQKALAQDGWFRWGATWVTAKQLDELKAAEAKIKEKLDAITKEGQDTRITMASIDAEIDANNREINRLQAASISYDSQGNQVQMPLPPAYYGLQRDNQKLLVQKQALQAHFDDLSTEYHKVENSGPVPQYAGAQKIFGVEATPVRELPGGDAPATEPSPGAVTQP